MLMLLKSLPMNASNQHWYARIARHTRIFNMTNLSKWFFGSHIVTIFFCTASMWSRDLEWYIIQFMYVARLPYAASNCCNCWSWRTVGFCWKCQLQLTLIAFTCIDCVSRVTVSLCFSCPLTFILCHCIWIACGLYRWSTTKTRYLYCATVTSFAAKKGWNVD